ncbi:hypothetical protein [Sporosarcina sp. FSL K6-1508]|uniref:hypothetical protein n=1 Tax=Sporosarcina sp. FSL K6-1508 TaxID=2921553 RepID=UPI0030F86045
MEITVSHQKNLIAAADQIITVLVKHNIRIFETEQVVEIMKAKLSKEKITGLRDTITLR